MKGLFWNVYKRDLFEPLVEMINENGIEIVVLAEAEKINVSRLCNELSKFGFDFKEARPIKKNVRVSIIYKQNMFKQETLRDNKRWLISRFFNNINDYILVGLHLPAINMNDEDKAHYIRLLESEIIEIERDMNNNRTILVGDFNCNPFDDAILNADGICGLPFKELTVSKSRVVKGKKYDFFYNPSWSLLNPQNPPYGTYYMNPHHLKTLYWHVVDQVILRPNLIQEFSQDDFKIIIETNSHHLLKNNKPNKKLYSDHLPITFKLQ